MGVVLIKMGVASKNFARASRAIVYQNPPSRNPGSAPVFAVCIDYAIVTTTTPESLVDLAGQPDHRQPWYEGSGWACHAMNGPPYERSPRTIDSRHSWSPLAINGPHYFLYGGTIGGRNIWSPL